MSVNSLSETEVQEFCFNYTKNFFFLNSDLLIKVRLHCHIPLQQIDLSYHSDSSTVYLISSLQLCLLNQWLVLAQTIWLFLCPCKLQSSFKIWLCKKPLGIYISTHLSHRLWIIIISSEPYSGLLSFSLIQILSWYCSKCNFVIGNDEFCCMQIALHCVQTPLDIFIIFCSPHWVVYAWIWSMVMHGNVEESASTSSSFWGPLVLMCKSA